LAMMYHAWRRPGICKAHVSEVVGEAQRGRPYVAEDAEEDVDDRIGGADAAFDPDWGRQSARDGDTARAGSPGRGGNRMASRPRKMSAEHIADVVFGDRCPGVR
jgi:hypothetical protein